MKSFYQQITTYTGDYDELLEKLNLLHIFKPIIEHFDKPTAKAIILYIAFAYTKDSEMVMEKEDWPRIKERCAKAAKLHKDLWTQVVHLVDKEPEMGQIAVSDPVPGLIRIATTNYLHYQEDRNNRDLKSLYDLYDEMVTASRSNLIDKDGLTDYKQKFACRDYANQILKWIEEAEDKLKEEDKYVRSAKKELNFKERYRGQSLRMENYVDSKH